jgi:hypothetical protein
MNVEDKYGAAIMAALGSLLPWSHDCHRASHTIVKARVFPQARVARGFCAGVGGQHSWVVVGDDCYDQDAQIIDPTLWSYDTSVHGIWYGGYTDGRHVPHGGFKSIWSWGMPPAPTREPVKLTPKAPLSPDARYFLELLGPLDVLGWGTLASHAPPGGWPAGEILSAMADTPILCALVPIDRLGMLTNRNPGGLYLATSETP